MAKRIQRSIWIDPDLAKWLKVEAARQGTNVSALIERAMLAIKEAKK